MFIIDKNNNEATAVERKTFKDLGFGEVQHLQEWIAKNPSMLGEELLIIQKEFAGFDDTYERLDLLALDKNGNLVVIENKLDDSGKDVTWQALKYVSYCSALSKNEIVGIYQTHLGVGQNAEERICDFFKRGESDEIMFDEIELNKGDQRIILVAANFRKEVTSTVLWLLEHGIKIKCIKVTPYAHCDNIFIDSEQIIPITDAEDYQIKLANKKRQEVIASDKLPNWHITRMKFWEVFLQRVGGKSDLFNGVNPSNENWISCGSGYSGIIYTVVASKSQARVELYINKGTKKYNERIFDELHKSKQAIESKFNFENTLEWERRDDGKSCKVVAYLRDVNLYKDEDWDIMIEFLIENVIKLNSAFSEELKSAMSNIGVESV